MTIHFRSPFCKTLTRFRMLLLVAVLGFAGCTGGEKQDESPSDGIAPTQEQTVDVDVPTIDRVRLAMRNEQWNQAIALIQQAMLENPNDPETLQLAADLAFANNLPNKAVDLMADAARADQFKDQTLVNRASTAHLALGRPHDCITFLQDAIREYPERHENRRRLYDQLINVEEYFRAKEHGRQLIRARQFDRSLLFSLNTTEQRDMDANSMTEFATRNPSDPRLYLATIRQRFDRAQWDGLEDLLVKILDYDQSNVPAQIMLGRMYIQQNRFDKMKAWLKRVTPDSTDTWQYWCVLGDWAFNRSRTEQAARAYWESIQRNIDIGEVHSKLARTLTLLRSQGDPIQDETISMINDRGEMLLKFMRDKERFYRLGNQDVSLVTEMIDDLVKLGRYWDAEAWAAYALTIPPTQPVKQAIESRRSQILSKLKKDTPWQATDGFPITELDLGKYPLPAIDAVETQLAEKPASPFVPSRNPVLKNEATQRGLASATSADPEKFAEGGIRLYAQMEAGGCAIDFDRDGWPDLYVASSSGSPNKMDSDSNHLYRNLSGRFSEVTQASGTEDRSFAQGVTFGDVNEDGFHDIAVFNYGHNSIFINNGDGSFSRRDDWLPSQVEPTWSTSGAFADLNSDGLTDLVVTRYCAGMDPFESPCFNEEGAEAACLPTQFAAQADVVMAGTREGRLVDRTKDWKMSPGEPGRGLGLVVGQLDGLPGQDIFVANDMTNNHFWSTGNSDEFSLAELGALKGVALDGRYRPQASMGIAASDLDDDGDIDLFVTNFEKEYNTFYEQTEGHLWADMTVSRGLAELSWSTLGFGTQAVDFDNDGKDEIAITNGHIHKTAKQPSSYAQKMQVLRRVTETRFDEAPVDSTDDYVDADHVGRSMWKTDINRDGRVDLAITHQLEPMALLVNHTKSQGDWLQLTFTGVDVARDAIGTTVTCTRGETTKFASLVTGDGFYCANERVLRFAFQSSPQDPIKVRVDWPDGSQQEFSVTAKRSYLIVQGQSEFDISH